MIHTNSDNLGFGMSVRHTQKTVVSELTPSYRVKLGLFALLGHAVVHGILLGSVIVLFAAVVWVDYAAPSDLTHVVLITLIPILLLLLSVLRIRLEKPQGYALRSTDFPELFTLLNDISQCAAASSYWRWRLTRRARTRSPGKAPSTNTAFCPARAIPRPSWARSSISNSNENPAFSHGNRTI